LLSKSPLFLRYINAVFTITVVPFVAITVFTASKLSGRTAFECYGNRSKLLQKEFTILDNLFVNNNCLLKFDCSNLLKICLKRLEINEGEFPNV